MTKKQRSLDTVTGAVDIMLDASKPLPETPSHVKLRPEDIPFFHGILRARAREDWNDADLVVAAQLARCQYDIEIESVLLYEEGSIIKNDRGTNVTNPRFGAINILKQSQLSAIRSLALHATAHRDLSDIGKKNKSFQDASLARKQIEDEELLA